MNRESGDNFTQLFAELEELKLRIAFAEMEKEDLDKIASDSENYSEIALKRTLEKIKKEVRRRDTAFFLHETLPRVCRVAAVVLLVCFVGLSAAIATVQSVRVKVLGFFMNIEDAYTELGFDNSGDVYMDVPADWTGSYYPAYIPDGFEFISIDPDFMEALYRNESGDILRFSENDESMYTNIDTENANTYWIQIGSERALVSEKDGHVFVAWAVDNRYFIVSLDGSREMATEIAKSVRMIN